MPKWVTTTWFHLSYGYDIDTKKGGWFSNGTTLSFTTPLDKLEQVLEKFTNYMDKKQAVIKAVLPLTSAIAHYDFEKSTFQNSSFGYGYGYGVTPTVGAIVIAQQEREVSSEEYEHLSKMQAIKDRLPELQELCDKLQQAVNADKNINSSIQEKKKLLGGVRYCIAEREFSSESEAKAAQAELLAQFTANQRALDKAQAELKSAQQELKSLKL